MRDMFIESLLVSFGVFKISENSTFVLGFNLVDVGFVHLVLFVEFCYSCQMMIPKY